VIPPSRRGEQHDADRTVGDEALRALALAPPLAPLLFVRTMRASWSSLWPCRDLSCLWPALWRGPGCLWQSDEASMDPGRMVGRQHSNTFVSSNLELPSASARLEIGFPTNIATGYASLRLLCRMLLCLSSNDAFSQFGISLFIVVLGSLVLLSGSASPMPSSRRLSSLVASPVLGLNSLGSVASVLGSSSRSKFVSHSCMQYLEKFHRTSYTILVLIPDVEIEFPFYSLTLSLCANLRNICKLEFSGE